MTTTKTRVLELNQNQANLLRLAVSLTKIGGLTVGHLATVKSLSKKLHGIVDGEPPDFIMVPERLHTLELDENEARLLGGFWQGFEIGLLPRGEKMLELIESTDRLINPPKEE